MNIYFVVVPHRHAGIQPYKATANAVAECAAVTNLSPVAKAVTALDIDNPSEQRWQRHFHVSPTCKYVEAEKVGLVVSELKWKHFQLTI